MLSYEVGADDSEETYYRITANNAGGFFSQEWVAGSKVYAACNVPDPITSVLFRGLIQRKQGKSRLYSLQLNYGVTSSEG